MRYNFLHLSYLATSIPLFGTVTSAIKQETSLQHSGAVSACNKNVYDIDDKHDMMN